MLKANFTIFLKKLNFGRPPKKLLVEENKILYINKQNITILTLVLIGNKHKASLIPIYFLE